MTCDMLTVIRISSIGYTAYTTWVSWTNSNASKTVKRRRIVTFGALLRLIEASHQRLANTRGQFIKPTHYRLCHLAKFTFRLRNA